MANTLTREPLSGSTNGRGIKIVATSTTGTTIHTAVSGTSHWDEITLYAVNTDSTDRKLTIEYGGVSSPDDLIEQTITAEGGLQIVLPALLLQNSLVVRGFAAAANVIIVHGWYVRRSTAS